MAVSMDGEMARHSRTVVVVRHAKAESEAAQDHDRRLTGRGRRDAAAAAPTVGGALADSGAGRSVALVSSAVRAVETWQLVAAGLPADGGVEERVLDVLFRADADDATGLLAGLGDDIAVAVVVGHNPAMEDTVRCLVAGGDAVALERLDDGLSTAAVAVLAYNGPWSDIGPGSCRLAGLEVGRG